MIKSPSRFLTKSFQESVGQQLYSDFTTDGVLSATKISNVLEKKSGKLVEVFGGQYVRDLQRLVLGLRLNNAGVAGQKLSKTTNLGQALRAVITPPLTRRGRAQTFVETVRADAAAAFLNEAIRDPKVLHAVATQIDRDVRSQTVMNLLGQYSALTAITVMDDDDIIQ